MDSEGSYPEDSINFKVVSRLKEISDMSNEEEESDEQDEG